MAQTQHIYNELMTGAPDQALRMADRAIEAGQGSLVHGTVLVLNPATSKYVKWDSAVVAAVSGIAELTITEDSVVTDVDFTGETVTSADVVATAALGEVTTANVNATPIVGLAILLEDVDATSEVVARVGLTGQIANSALVLAGSVITTVTNYVRAVLQLNGIFVTVPTNANVIAGE